MPTGGLFSFTAKIGVIKAKTWYFAYTACQWGGYSPPASFPPGQATAQFKHVRLDFTKRNKNQKHHPTVLHKNFNSLQFQLDCIHKIEGLHFFF